MQKIENIEKDLEEIRCEVNGFSGGKNDKSYLKLEHLLTTKILKLDSIDTSSLSLNKDVVRNQRKSAIKKIQAVIDDLEIKSL